jgi:N-acetylglucosaminyl-diphospho-decaprenol L-rhamnosyltransferase
MADAELQPVLTVIIVSYNTRDLTLMALHTLFATTRTTSIHVVVLDNASTDGSADAVAETFPQVEMIRSSENLGFARANNVVAAAARTEWLLLLNPDTECHEGAVDNLMAFARAHPNAGIWGGRTVFPNGSLNITSCWRRSTPWSLFCLAVGLTAAFPRSNLFDPEAFGSWKRDSVREVDIVTGCFFLIRRELWVQLSGFDLRYFMYGEEADLCLRAARMRYRPMITPAAQIMHLVGAASSNRADKLLLLLKARITLIRDHWSATLVPLGVGLMWLWGALRIVAATVLAPLTGAKGRARAAYWRGIWSRRHEWLRGY